MIEDVLLEDCRQFERIKKYKHYFCLFVFCFVKLCRAALYGYLTEINASFFRYLWSFFSDICGPSF